jgi:hypothetical protein
MLMVMSFPKDLDILENPNIWIADLAATCDSTSHHQGAVTCKKETAELYLVMKEIMKLK